MTLGKILRQTVLASTLALAPVSTANSEDKITFNFLNKLESSTLAKKDECNEVENFNIYCKKEFANSGYTNSGSLDVGYHLREFTSGNREILLVLKSLKGFRSHILAFQKIKGEEEYILSSVYYNIWGKNKTRDFLEYSLKHPVPFHEQTAFTRSKFNSQKDILNIASSIDLTDFMRRIDNSYNTYISHNSI